MEPKRGLQLRGCLKFTHIKRTIPVLDIAKANPRIPLPMMALLRLKTDMPNEVLPSNCRRVRHKTKNVHVGNDGFTPHIPKVFSGLKDSRQ